MASKENGYMRITKLKEMGSEDGGRIFLYRGDHSKVQDCIDYIEKREVLVKNISSILNKTYKTEESTKNKWNFID